MEEHYEHVVVKEMYTLLCCTIVWCESLISIKLDIFKAWNNVTVSIIYVLFSSLWVWYLWKLQHVCKTQTHVILKQMLLTASFVLSVKTFIQRDYNCDVCVCVCVCVCVRVRMRVHVCVSVGVCVCVHCIRLNEGSKPLVSWLLLLRLKMTPTQDMTELWKRSFILTQ